MKVTLAPLTPDRWPDLEAVFNARGCSIARSCWCMAYRRSGSDAPGPPGMTRAKANRAALKALVVAGRPPGLLGYRGKVPVGWVSLAPREQYAKLKRSPVMREVSPVLTRETTMWKTWIGFNASHSYGAILFGLVYGYLAIAEGAMFFRSPFLLLVGLLLLVGYTFLGKMYWFRIPFRGIVLATAFYFAALVINWT